MITISFTLHFGLKPESYQSGSMRISPELPAFENVKL